MDSDDARGQGAPVGTVVDVVLVDVVGGGAVVVVVGGAVVVVVVSAVVVVVGGAVVVVITAGRPDATVVTDVRCVRRIV